jgi:D-amino-acid oxidase
MCETAELPEGFVTGWRFTAPLIDVPTYLGYLQRRLQAASGNDRPPAHQHAQRGDRSPFVLNGAGIGAHDLVPDPS